MSTSVLDTASAIITRRFDLSGGAHVEIFVWKPEAVVGSDYSCSYQIAGLGSEKVRIIFGIDALQALEMALIAVGSDLYYSEAYKAGSLTWLGTRDLGLPTWPGEKPGVEEFESAQLLTSASQSAVVVMPDKRFPYVAYPGYRLDSIIKYLKEAEDEVQEESGAKLRLKTLVNGLTRERKYYEAICERAGFQTSYLKSPADQPAK